MNIKFYNTINRRKEDFNSIVDKEVKLYTCGPTVYDFAHIGNFRAYLFEDILRRTLEYFGYKVLHVMNITDIDDKTIKKSIEENKSLKDFTSFYTNAFFEDVKSLNILPAHHYPRATEFIPEMIEMIQKLETKGYTYNSSDNSVFFRISKFKEYGKLANLNPEDMMSGQRVEDDEYDKELLFSTVTRFEKTLLKVDERKALNYLTQSTTSDIVLENAYKIMKLLEGRKSNIAFTLHDSVVLDFAREDHDLVRETDWQADIQPMQVDTDLQKVRVTYQPHQLQPLVSIKERSGND